MWVLQWFERNEVLGGQGVWVYFIAIFNRFKVIGSSFIFKVSEEIGKSKNMSQFYVRGEFGKQLLSKFRR